MNPNSFDTLVRWSESDRAFRASSTTPEIVAVEGRGPTRAEAIAAFETNLNAWSSRHSGSFKDGSAPASLEDDPDALRHGSKDGIACGECVIQTVSEAAEYIEFAVVGDLEIHNIAEARTAVQKALIDKVADQRAVIVNMAAAQFIDSAGLGLLIKAAHHARTQGQMFYLIDVQPRLSRVLQVTGFDRIFKSDLTREDAIASIRQNCIHTKL